MEQPTVSRPRATSTRRRAAVACLALLSAITGAVSYLHGLEVARWTGSAGLVAYLIPLVPDLMIVTSSLVLLEASELKAGRPRMAMVALVAGIGWTVAMNVAAGARSGAGGALIAGGVPLAFVLTFESLLWLYRRGRAVSPVPGGPPTGGQDPPTTGEALRVLLGTGSQRGLADDLGVSRSRVEAWAARVRPPAGAAASMNGGTPHE